MIRLFFLSLMTFPSTLAGSKAVRAIVAGKTILPDADQTGNGIDYPEGKRAAVMANPTSIIGGTQLVDSLWKRGVNIVKVFGPGHGFQGDAPAGIAVKEENDPATGILEGTSNEPLSFSYLVDCGFCIRDIFREALVR